MPLHRIIATVSLALTIAVFPCLRDSLGELKNDSPELKAAFDALEKHLEKTGYDSATLFAHPDFEIYDNIADFFRKSAESEGIRPYNKALKRGDEKEAARVYEEEFEKYKRRIGFDKKKRDLREFMEMYADELAVSEEKFGIPKEVTASVIGLESLFGKTTGKHRAFNVYVSMYVYNYRKKFALSQLEELLRFSKKTDISVFAFKSSYAGAIGAMQFLPYSLNRWFVGSDVDDMGDCIASAANYLAHFKKKRGTIEKAVFSYNPSKLYASTVFALADYAREISPAPSSQ